jgi:hypothetical protein
MTRDAGSDKHVGETPFFDVFGTLVGWHGGEAE